MADEIKPPSSSLSPLSPQIKVPPVNQAPTDVPSSFSPSNLPIGEIRPLQQSQAAPPEQVAPGSDPVQAPNQAQIFKSSIRTMQEDIAALKKGSAPMGFQIEKQSEKAKPVIEPPVANPATLPSSQTLSHIELGRLEKSKPLPSSITPPIDIPGITPLTPPLPDSVKPMIDIPSSAGGIFDRFKNFGQISRKRIIIYTVGGLAGFIITAYLIPYFASPASRSVTPTPRLTTTAVPVTARTVENAFKIFSKINLAVESDVFDKLLININKNDLAGGEPGLYKIVNPQSGLDYSFSSFMSSALVTVPEEIIPLISNDNFYLTLTQKTDNNYGRGYIVKLKNDTGVSEAVIEALSRWELNMSANLKTIFALNIEQASSVNFLNNTYQGSLIKYRNFPDYFSTIDYAVVTEASGDKYLVFTNSREHIYSIIDKLR